LGPPEEEGVSVGEGLDLFERGIPSEFAQNEALGSDIDESEFGDDVVDDFNAVSGSVSFLFKFSVYCHASRVMGNKDALGTGNKSIAPPCLSAFFPEWANSRASFFVDLPGASR